MAIRARSLEVSITIMALEGRRARGCRYRIIAYIQRGGWGYGTYVERQGFAKMSNAQGHIREEVWLVYGLHLFSASIVCKSRQRAGRRHFVAELQY